MAVVTQPMMMTPAGPIPNPMQGAVQAQPVGGAVPFNPRFTNRETGRKTGAFDPSMRMQQGGGGPSYDATRQPWGNLDAKIGDLRDDQGRSIYYNSATGQMELMSANPVTQQPTPQYGLAGAEAAAQAGMRGGVNALQTGQNRALGLLQGGQNFAQQQLGQGRGVLSGALAGGMSQLQQGTTGAMNQLAAGQQALGGSYGAGAATVNPLTGRNMFQQAASGVQAYSPAGLQAQQMQAALSGAQGQEAFDKAFINSPVQKFLREQGERSLINQASATGGLGGGEVLRELTEFGQGLAGTQLQQQIANLQALSGQGLQAAGQAGQFLSQAGQQEGNLAAQNASMQTQANIQSAANRLAADQARANLFGQGASALQRAGEFGANLLGQTASQQANLFGQGADIARVLAGQGASLESGTGQNIANLISGTGSGIANLRSQAGRDLANQITGSTSALADLAKQQGSGLSDIIGAGGVNIGNLLSGAGLTEAQQQQNLATILSNLATGEGSTLANLALQRGDVNAQADLAKDAALQSGLQNLLNVGGLLAGGV